MSPERWERIKELFEAALDRSEPERSSFLVKECSGDEPLRREVESLLSGHRRAGDFLEAPAFQQHAALLVRDLPPSTFGVEEVISGRFQVLRFIGRGGMGEVYAAMDLELGVCIALKTIRPEIASEPGTMARFKQEIELARRVAHQNVCRMHDLEHHQPPKSSGEGEIVFLTMELLEGETLAERLHRQVSMSCGEALPLIRQLAEGLAAAHNVGVVHCDFKPGNVMLVSSGPAGPETEPSTQAVTQDQVAPKAAAARATARAVITDFGLARAMRPAVTREAIQESQTTGAPPWSGRFPTWRQSNWKGTHPPGPPTSMPWAS